jgi:hypothetical protein
MEQKWHRAIFIVGEQMRIFAAKTPINMPILWVFFEMVAGGGIEPPTQGFSVLCSTN